MRSPAEYEAEIDKISRALDYEARWRRVLAEGLEQERERSDAFEALSVARKERIVRGDALLLRCLPFVEDCEDGDLIAAIREALEMPAAAEPSERALPWDTIAEAMGDR